MKAEDREIFGDFLEKIMKRFRCSSGSIALCNGERKTFRVIASRGLKLERLEKGIDVHKGVTGLIYRNKKAVLIDHEHPLPPEFKYQRQRELCSICLPLIDSQKQVIGIVSLNKKSGTFSTSKVILLRLLIQEIAALAEQILLREEGEKATLNLQVGFTELLQDCRPSDINAVLQKIAEISSSHSGAWLSVLHAPLFTDSPLFHPPKPAFSFPQWNRCQEFLSPYIKRVWRENVPQVLQVASEMYPLPRASSPRVQDSVTVEIHPVAHNQKTLGVLLLFLEKPLSPHHRLSLGLLLTLGGVLLQNHRLLRETEALVRRQERLKLAQEIHNNLTQDLAGIQLYIEALRAKVVRKNFESREVVSTLQKVDLALRRCLGYSRDVLKALQKSIDEKRPFPEKIAEIFERQSLLSTQKLHYTLKINLPDHALPQGIQEILLQLVAEAVNNTLKHAQAKQAWVKIGTWQDKIYLLFRDDGKGFDTRDLPPAHGLSILAQQIFLQKGSLRISSSRSRGTIIKVVLPIYG